MSVNSTNPQISPGGPGHSPAEGGYNRRAFMKQVLTAGALANLPLLAQAAGELKPVAESATPAPDPESPSPTCGNRTPSLRRLQAYNIRVQAALAEMQQPIPPHPDNGDEVNYPTFAPFSKGFPHTPLGEIVLPAYMKYRKALKTGDPEDFEEIPLGCTNETYYRLVNPQSGLAFDLEGVDSHATFLPPAPGFYSPEEAGEIAEDYWMALARDIPFCQYDTNPLIQKAAADLSKLSDFRGPQEKGAVTPDTIFRGALRGQSTGDWVRIPGCLKGPYISQFFWLPIPFGATYVDPRMVTTLPGTDYMTDFAEWLHIQNGCRPHTHQDYDSKRRYIRNGRDLGQWVHVDVLHQAYFQAMLTLLAFGAELNPGNPYDGATPSATQDGFGTFSAPHIATLLPEVSTRALHAVWFQKWFVHRRLRPEEFAGRIHLTLTGVRDYGLGPDLDGSKVLEKVYKKFQSYLLPMAFSEGCPLHPSYGSGHATVAGACVTILKAWFNGAQRMVDFLGKNSLQPVEAAPDGLSLVPYTGPDANKLTIEGELNKLATNVALGRDFAGVHWRSDQMESLRLGEAVAISILRDQKKTYNENFRGFTFRKFDGTEITI